MPTASPRFDSIEIPDRPSVASETPAGGGFRKRVLLWGGIAAAALVALLVIAALFSGGDQKLARSPAEAPLIKAEEQPIKVTPESPGGMQVPNRDMLVYERMHGAAGGKPPVEQLLPEPEKPVMPPQTKPLAPPAEPPAFAASSAVPLPLPSASPPPAAPPVAPLPPAEPPSAVARSTPPPPAASPPSKPPAVVAMTPPKSPPPPATARQAAPERPAAPEKPAVAEKAAKGGSSGFQVQLLAGRSQDEVKGAWTKLKAKNADLLGPLSPTLARADLGDRGTYYRLRAGPLDSEAKARALCDRLSGRGASCIIIRPGG